MARLFFVATGVSGEFRIAAYIRVVDQFWYNFAGAAFELYDQVEFDAGNYFDFGIVPFAAEIAPNSGVYGFNYADFGAGKFIAVSGLGGVSDFAEIFSTGDDGEEISGAIDTSIFPENFALMLIDGGGQVTAVGGVSSGALLSGQTAAINDDLTAAVLNFFERSFLITGTDSAGWTRFVFTIKNDADSDADAESLIMVKVSNAPDAVNDGLNTLNRQVYATHADGTLAVTSVAGVSTTVVLTLAAAGLNIPPSPSSTTYRWELTRYIGTKKEQLGTGRFTAARGVWRGAVQP